MEQKARPAQDESGSDENNEQSSPGGENTQMPPPRGNAPPAAAEEEEARNEDDIKQERRVSLMTFTFRPKTMLPPSRKHTFMNQQQEGGGTNAATHAAINAAAEGAQSIPITQIMGSFANATDMGLGGGDGGMQNDEQDDDDDDDDEQNKGEQQNDKQKNNNQKKGGGSGKKQGTVKAPGGMSPLAPPPASDEQLRVLTKGQVQQSGCAFRRVEKVPIRYVEHTFTNALIALTRHCVVYARADNVIVIIDARTGKAVFECTLFTDEERAIGVVQALSDQDVVVAGRGCAALLQITTPQDVTVASKLRFNKDAFAVAYHARARALALGGRDYSWLRVLGFSSTRTRTVNVYQQSQSNTGKWTKRAMVKVRAQKSAAIVTHIEWGADDLAQGHTLALLVQSDALSQFFVIDLSRDLKDYELQHVVDMQQYHISRVFHLSFNGFLRKWIVARERRDAKSNCFFALDPQRDSRVVRCEEFPVNEERSLQGIIYSPRAPRVLIVSLGEGTGLGLYDLLEEQLVEEIEFPPYARFSHALAVPCADQVLLLSDELPSQVVSTPASG